MLAFLMRYELSLEDNMHLVSPVEIMIMHSPQSVQLAILLC